MSKKVFGPRFTPERIKENKACAALLGIKSAEDYVDSVMKNHNAKVLKDPEGTKLMFESEE